MFPHHEANKRRERSREQSRGHSRLEKLGEEGQRMDVRVV
jgi:hypothetical protein